MHQQYTTLILHLSSYVERKKQSLLTRHSWKSFFDVVSLVFAELLLAIVSLPLHLSTKEETRRTGSAKKYSVRRVLTRGIVGIVIVLWALKIGLIFFRERTDRHIVNVQKTERGQKFSMPRIVAAMTDPNLQAPKITGISGSEQLGLVVHGTATAKSAIALYTTRTAGDDASVKMYLAKTEYDGTFLVHEDKERFRLRSGEYAMQAFAYDDARDVKSAGSNIVTAVAVPSRFESVTAYLDTAVNIIVSILLVVGIFTTLLLL